jgi:hypothetical protein
MTDSHWAVHADGYAPTEEYGRIPDAEILLKRGGRYHGRVLDPFGAPLVGVDVGYKLGCAHAPSLAGAVTDASGRFEFARVEDGEWPIAHPGVEAIYVPARPAHLPAPVLVTMPARPIEGRLLLADGSAPPWAVVQNYCSPRGPLALVRKDGSFTIRGGMMASALTVYLNDETVDIPTNAYPGNYPFTFVVGGEEEDDARVVLVRTADDLELDAVLVRKRDGRAMSITTDIEADAPAGEYRVEVGSEFTQYRTTADVPADGKLLLALKEQARLDVIFPDNGIAENVNLRLLLDGTWMDLEAPFDDPIYLPRAGRAVIFAELDGARAWFPVGSTTDGRRAVTVQLPEEKRIRLPGVSRDTAVEIHGDETWRPYVRDGLVTLRATGRIVAEYDSYRAEFDLPKRASGIVEPTRVDRDEPVADTPVRLLLPDGSPAVEAEVIDAEGQSLADKDGIALVSAARDGTRVILKQQNSNLISQRITLRGDGPYVLQWGTCTLRFAIPDVAMPLVWLDGAVRDLDEDLVLIGLSEGPHTLIIGAPGRKHYVMRIVLKPGETRTIDLTLPRALPRNSAKTSAPR